MYLNIRRKANKIATDSLESKDDKIHGKTYEKSGIYVLKVPYLLIFAAKLRGAITVCRPLLD